MKRERFVLRLRAELKAACQARAFREDESLAHVVRVLLREWLATPESNRELDELPTLVKSPKVTSPHALVGQEDFPPERRLVERMSPSVANDPFPEALAPAPPLGNRQQRSPCSYCRSSPAARR